MNCHRGIATLVISSVRLSTGGDVRSFTRKNLQQQTIKRLAIGLCRIVLGIVTTAFFLYYFIVEVQRSIRTSEVEQGVEVARSIASSCTNMRLNVARAIFLVSNTTTHKHEEGDFSITIQRLLGILIISISGFDYSFSIKYNHFTSKLL